jgi:glycosyltransferase involved in cell wall biosynthesis
MSKLISIITPVYNASKYIAETIESVIAQTYWKWEMIIIDDCSYDGSKKIIKEFMKRDGRIKLIELDQNKGPALARNIGTKIARGTILLF